jgi:hypothetical protein
MSEWVSEWKVKVKVKVYRFFKWDHGTETWPSGGANRCILTSRHQRFNPQEIAHVPKVTSGLDTVIKGNISATHPPLWIEPRRTRKPYFFSDWYICIFRRSFLSTDAVPIFLPFLKFVTPQYLVKLTFRTHTWFENSMKGKFPTCPRMVILSEILLFVYFCSEIFSNSSLHEILC